MAARTIEDDWLWGWDPTPGIVSVWAEPDGRVDVWRRVAGALVHETVRFRPWVLVAHAIEAAGRITCRELAGDGALRYVVRADDMPSLSSAILRAAQRRLGRPFGHLRDLGAHEALALPVEEQYLVATGRTYFRDLAFDELQRLQIDLETTGLNPARDRIFLVAIRDPRGDTMLLEAAHLDDAGEADLIARTVARIGACDPDVVENHNLFAFDLAFLDERARRLGVPLALGRTGAPGLRRRAARRGLAVGEGDGERRVRFTVPGRELIDTLDAVLRHDFGARELPGHGLKAVARYFGLARSQREHVPGAQIHAVYERDPDRVRRYASDDVAEVAALARVLGGAAFALAKMAPRRYERLADAGAATGVLDPLLVRAYLRSGAALPVHDVGTGIPHDGAALRLFNAGVAHRIVKADVASLYPSLMRQYRIGPARDRLGALLAIVDRLVEQRLAAKAAARAAPPDSAERLGHAAVSAAMKLIVNSAYGYLGAPGLTRFSDVDAANAITRHGRELLDRLCRELAGRGVTLLEADTDGVYFAVPPDWTEADERRVVAEVAALLPPLVHLEFDGRYAAMLSHEPKNYALQPYPAPTPTPLPTAPMSSVAATSASLILRGVAFRSSRAEPFGEAFLRRAIACVLARDVFGVRAAYVETAIALRRRTMPTYDVSARVRLTKSPSEYLATRTGRRELAYEAVLASGRTTWSVGERVRIYRAVQGRAGVVTLPDDESDRSAASDPRDYDSDHYLHVLREHFASRFARAFTPDDFATVFADPEQPSLFARPLSDIQPVLQPVVEAVVAESRSDAPSD